MARRSPTRSRRPGKRVRAGARARGLPRGGRRSPRRSPGSRPRSRSCTPTPWCTTTSPAWTTTTCAAGGPPRTSPSTCPPRPGSGFLLVPVAAQVLAAAADELGLPPAALGRMAAELFEAGGIEGMVGGQWLDLEAEGRQLDAGRADRGPPGQDRRAHPGLPAPWAAIAARGRRRPMVAALTAYGDDVGLAFQIADDVLDATGTSEAAGQDGRPRRRARQVHLRAACWASRRPAPRRSGWRGRPWRGSRHAGGAERGTRGPGGLYCDEELVADDHVRVMPGAANVPGKSPLARMTSLHGTP